MDLLPPQAYLAAAVLFAGWFARQLERQWGGLLRSCDLRNACNLVTAIANGGFRSQFPLRSFFSGVCMCARLRYIEPPFISNQPLGWFGNKRSTAMARGPLLPTESDPFLR